MVAIMGPGKNTLLNVLAGVSNGKLSGSILFNGAKCSPKDFRKNIAYVKQDDLLYKNLSVRETIDYAVQMRLPSNQYDQTAKKERVEEIIRLLRLNECADTFIGDSSGGISGGERKRTSIGIEVVTDSKILFLDDPTSGLDSNSAFSVCETVRDVARNTGRCVLMTIHQPSNKILDLFDRIILLGGKEVLFNGTKNEILDFFANVKFPCPKHTNLADHFLDFIAVDSNRVYRNIKDYKHTSQDKTTVKGMENDNSLSNESIIKSMVSVENQSWSLSWPMEFSLLLKRAALSTIRDKFSIIVKLVTCVFFGLLVGIAFGNLGYSQSSIHNRVGLFTLLAVGQVSFLLHLSHCLPHHLCSLHGPLPMSNQSSLIFAA
ncbi:hypothetical protein K7432_016462 [Basidiobolus ranarum]